MVPMDNTNHTNTIEVEERLRRRREIARLSAARKRAENRELARDRMREYMQTSGKAREYYWKNRDEIVAKKRERYANKKQQRQQQIIPETTEL